MLRYSRCSKSLQQSQILSEELWMQRLHTGNGNLPHARFMRPMCRKIGKGPDRIGVSKLWLMDTGDKNEGYALMVMQTHQYHL